jgi:hypothetical protein
MTLTTLESLEKRVAALEHGMAEWLRARSTPADWKDWRAAVGQFSPTELSEEVDAAGREIREADRRQCDS